MTNRLQLTVISTSLLLIASASFGQQLKSAGKISEAAAALETDADGNTIWLKPQSSWSTASDKALPELLSKAYGLKETTEISELSTQKSGNMVHSRLQQSVKGIPVEGGEVIVHRTLSGEINSVSGTLRNVISDESFSISAAEAEKIAIRTTGKDRPYSWLNADDEAALKSATENPNASYKPVAKLVFAPVNGDFNSDYRLSWKLTLQIGGDSPARMIVYVDAKTGNVINSYNSIHTTAATGTGTSLYSGTVSLGTDLVSSTYYLRDLNRKIQTFNMNNKTSYTSAAIFTDTDNVWNTTVQKAGVDAHYGASWTYDYYKNTQGRNSFDNAGAIIKSYVHYSTRYNNAYWNGSVMTYGDGDGTTFTPLVTLDVAGHEITHAVTERSANLAYQNESGALNEAWSDIFGTAIEFYAKGTAANWLIGEDCYTPATSGDALRSMSNPNSGQQPDTYQGTYWYTGTGDNGGVHYNSGVANFWFYLLSVGGSGTNDKSTAYSVTGIGITKAARIAYVALTSYMTSSTNYAGARTATLNAASQLYGATSPEYTAVNNAWAAVNVGGSVTPPPPATFTPYTEVESNGTTGTANVIPALPVKITAKIGTTTDLDYFKSSVGAGKVMTLKMTPPSTKDYDLYVYNSAGTLITKSENGSGAVENISVSNTGTTAAIVYIQIKGYNRAYSTTLTYTCEVSEAAAISGISSLDSETPAVASAFELTGNYPNPFNPSTKITFSVPEKGLAKVEIFNILGQNAGVILNEVVDAGRVSVDFNASGLTSGTYLYRVTFGNQVKSGKMILTK